MQLGRAGTAVVAAAAAFGVAGLATAAIPGGDGVVDLCYDKQGSVRVVDEGVACRGQETALAINQQGPAGPAGADGANGADGADGVAPAEFDTGGGFDLSSSTLFTDVTVRSESSHLLLAHATVGLSNLTGSPQSVSCRIRHSPLSDSVMGDFLAPEMTVTVPASGDEQIVLAGHGRTAPSLAFYDLVLQCDGSNVRVESSTHEVLLTRDSSGG